MRATFRDLLPQRRPNETFDMIFGGQNKPFTVTLGYYEDGRIGEVFIDGPKIGSEMKDITHDAAMLFSLALQHGVPMQTIQHALSRDAAGKATTIIGAVIDEIVKRTNG
jgi:hypothetical protein